MNKSIKKFDNKGKIYSSARPDYPDEMFRYLLDNGIIDKDSTAADIGAGTGIFSTHLAQFVSKIYAVEPNADMRKQAENEYAKLGNIKSIIASAEQTGLSDGSVDIVTAAQAFHWFDKAKFKAECKRILKPNGKVILVWNDRDTSSPLIKQNFAVNKELCPNFKGSSNGFDFANEFDDFFENGYIKKDFQNNLKYDLNQFIARNLSSSYAPTENDEGYNEYISRLTEVFADFEDNGIVEYPYITSVYYSK